MPEGKRQQSNTMLYALIIFVGLFIITTTFAVYSMSKLKNTEQKQQACRAKWMSWQQVSNCDK